MATKVKKAVNDFKKSATDVKLNKVVDIEKLVEKRAKRYYKENDLKSNLHVRFGKPSFDDLRVEIDTSRLVIDHEEPTHEASENEAEKSKETVAQDTILFKGKYNNATKKPKEYQVIAERKSTTTRSLSVENGFHIGGGFKINLGTPKLGVNLGLSGQVDFSGSVQHSEAHEYTWTVNTTILVPEKSCTTVKLRVENKDYCGTFSYRSFFSGIIVVKLYLGNCYVTQIPFDDLRDIFTEEEGFGTDENKGLFYETRGNCHFRYGAEQSLRVTEGDLEPEEAECKT